MLRASWRSAVTPTRGHVCWSCLSRGLTAPPHQQLWARSFQSRSRLRSQALASTETESLPNPPAPNQSDINQQLGSEPQSGSHPKAGHNEVSREDGLPNEASDKKEPDLESPGGRTTVFARTTQTTSGKLKARQSLKPLPVKTADVPGLAFGLDRVLFNQGVYTLRDPRSRVYNFDPYLGSIMPVTEFDFQALKDYITSSKDKQLHSLAREAGRKYIGSSSSMTSVLSHFHYLLSAWRPVDTSSLSQGFSEELKTFTRLLRAPAAMFLHYQDGVYAIDADKEFDSANILMNLGKSMEKLLTLPKSDFERYRRSSANKITPEEENAIPESYHYSTLGDFLMRSQLDAHDPRLPGTGMFDLKTRAVVSIRMDARNFEHGLGYEIRRPLGLYESYEREYYDMIRAAFLKYSLQVRVGRMDGIFVAFHNIERIFGFQYISLNEMDKALHGQFKLDLGDREFELSIQLWNDILNRVTKAFPKQSLRFHFETRGNRPGAKPHMYIFAEPVTADEIAAIQNKNKEAIDAYQKRVLNLPDEPVVESAKDEGEDEAVEDEDPKYDTTLKDPTDAVAEGAEDEDYFCLDSKPEIDTTKKLFAAVLTIDNYVNDKLVPRPENFGRKDKWEVSYKIDHLDPEDSQTHRMYAHCQKRRRDALDFEKSDGLTPYLKKLRSISQAGRRYRERENQRDRKNAPVVYRTLPPTGIGSPIKVHVRHLKLTEKGSKQAAKKPHKKASQKHTTKPAGKPRPTKKTSESPPEPEPSAEQPAQQTSTQEN
ncbi:Pet127 family protein [Aspergillus brunneoviolaceus CBS 621.78]|uniref:Pet127-domain-containing protein n=1 Tax=Aspergillus brunneoviolaceus CBS 621.78 TaxID=1450534 RepID=A0ACD1G129_9EURO|nr:Pet127-domain-containing protein [Aspergillus brunneoviolaceus CBS 621.78]RAH42951.1 Pet127-domain-containing protein [Aspergillus brunneoviolaceus CBS 621.78]